MSAGADDPALAAGRVSVISTIGYCAFLVGPPLIGLLGDRITVLNAGQCDRPPRPRGGDRTSSSATLLFQ